MPTEFKNYAADWKPIPPRESGPKRWDRDVLRLDGGGAGVKDCSGWLDAYWMGRYYGLIKAPTVKDPKLLTVKDTLRGRKGANPYKGPKRPDIFDF